MPNRLPVCYHDTRKVTFGTGSWRTIGWLTVTSCEVTVGSGACQKRVLAIVADVNDKGDRSFSSAEELWRILEEKRGSVNEHKVHRGGHYGKREWQG